MTRSKKIFAAFVIAFAILLALVVYDISTRTQFPGSRPHYDIPASPGDSIPTDSVTHRGKAG